KSPLPSLANTTEVAGASEHEELSFTSRPIEGVAQLETCKPQIVWNSLCQLRLVKREMLLAEGHPSDRRFGDFVDRHCVGVHPTRHHRRHLKHGVDTTPKVVLCLMTNTAILIVPDLPHKARRFGGGEVGLGSQLLRSVHNILQAKSEC